MLRLSAKERDAATEVLGPILAETDVVRLRAAGFDEWSRVTELRGEWERDLTLTRSLRSLGLEAVAHAPHVTPETATTRLAAEASWLRHCGRAAGVDFVGMIRGDDEPWAHARRACMTMRPDLYGGARSVGGAGAPLFRSFT